MSWSNDVILKQWIEKEENEDINGEMVERKARDQQRFELVKTGVSAVGFVMAVVGIWGDAA